MPSEDQRQAGWQQARHACDRGDRSCPRENGRLLLAEPAPSCSPSGLPLSRLFSVAWFCAVRK